MKRRVSAMLLVAALCVSLMPTNVLAAGETTPDDEGEEIAVLSIDPETDEAEESVNETEQEASLPEDTAEVTSEEESVPEDDADEETKALTGEGSFLYEDSDLTLKVKVSGNVNVPNAEKEISWEDVTMNASKLGKDSDTYSQMESYAEESSGDLGSLIVMTLSFLYEGSELDVSDCDVDVTVEPSQDLINDAMPEPSDDEEGSSSVLASIVEADGDEVKELDSVTIGEDDDKDDVELNGELSEDEFGVMVLTAADPTFTVQFYANLDVIYREHQEGDTDLTVIETHNEDGSATLPANGTTPKTSTIELKPSGSEYIIDSEEVLTKMYVDEDYEFVDEPDLHHMNKLEINSDYELKEIWKLNEDGNPDSTDNNNNDWTVYQVTRTGDTTYSKDFTNDPEAAAADQNLILVQDNDIFRFVYDTTSNTANLDTNFYDYNITDGNVYSEASTSSSPWESGTKWLYTYKQGINDDGNYTGSGTAKYAFGNENTGSGLGNESWDGYRLNAPNRLSYQNCTFGLVSGLDNSTGNVVFSSGIDAPNIFYGEAVGKQTFTGQLFFNREGDTYTLTSAELSDGTGAGSGYDTFIGRSEYEGGSSFGSTIYSNDFWPMDKVSYDGMDPQFGNYADYAAGNVIRRFNSSGTTGTLPPSDDSADHNSYFGMNFEIEFSYTSDYVGPLEYFFFGDDDMWVFLDDQLILDIGGVHSSVGEHVDLWDYLSQDAQPTADGEPTTYTHTLSVFYTERGASGSTCYIQYTLPEVSSVTTVEDASNLLIEKEVEGADTDEDFEFTLTLKDGEGTELTNQYSYIVLNKAGNFEYSDTIKSGGTFTLKNGWRALIRNLPNGTVATATETRVPGYSTTYEVGANTAGTVSIIGSGTTASGTVIADDTTYIKFVNASDTPVKDVDADGDGEYGDSGVQAEVGDTLEYKIDYVNNTGETVTVTITDALDKGLDFVSADNGGTYDESTRTITWVLENVEADAPISVTFKAKINENALETNEIENTAKVKVNGDPEVETEPVYTPVPDKDVDADGDGKYGDSDELVQIGDTLTYKIDYFNGYDVAADVVITDTLDQGLTYVSSDPEATYNESTRTLTWTLSSVEALTGGSVTFKATVNSSALENENLEIDNEAYVKVGDDSQVETNPVDNKVLVVEVSGEKVWDDEDNEYNSRPESITIHLLADGEPAKDYDSNEITATVTPDAKGKWTWSFTNLPKYKTVVDGTTGETTKTEIAYTVTEDAIPDYTLDGITGDAENGFVITNKLVEPKISKRVHEDDYERKEESGEHMHDGEDTDGEGEGTWDDADNNQEVTYHLKVTEIKNVLNLIIHDYLEDGLDFELETVEITLYDNGDETELVENTDFTVTQGACSDPECSMDGCTFEIKFESDNPFADVSSDAYLAVTYKALTDTHEQDYDDYEDDILNASYMTYGSYDLQTLSGMRRSAVAYAETDLFGFGIYKYSIEDGEEVALADAEFTLERDGVYATFETEYDEDTGDKYYMVSGWEDDASAATTPVSGEDGLIRIEGLDDDTYTITETQAPVGYDIVDEAITVIIDEDGNVTVSGDTGSKEAVIGHVVNVENTEILTEVSGTKTWNDNDDQDGYRPESITIYLLADGEVVDSVVVTEADNWSYSFTDLPMYKDGVEISYTILEEAIDHYGPVYSGYDIENDHTPDQTSVSVTKAWDDAGDQDGIRPESVTVQLYADDEAVEGATLTLDESNNWTGSFTGLDIYHDHGERIAYTIKEEDVLDGYECTIETVGESDYVYAVTNTHTPETTEIAGSKTWDDNDNEDGVRPESITIHLLAGDTEVDSLTVTEADGWAWSFTDLPKYKDGTEIVYTITEDDVDKYETSIDGYDVTNTHEHETVDVSGAKTWDDNDDKEGKRPSEITIILLADGEQVDSITVTEKDDWAWAFTDLDKYNDGVEIVYTITEDAVDGYETEINGYDVTNTIQETEPETRDISGSKTWDDDDNKADARPESITVNLYQNDELYNSKTVTEADGWSWNWAGLPKYDEDGKEYAYTIDEDTVEYYTPTYQEGSFDITNTFVGEEGAEHPTSGPEKGGDTPKTGDTNNIGLWIALLIAAMAAVFVAFRLRKRS